MAIKEPRRLVPTDQGHADVFNEPIDTLYENDQELASQIESIKTDPTGNGVASKEALDDHAADTDLHVTAEKQAKWDAAETNAKTYTEKYAAPKSHTHTASDLPSASTQARGITQLTNSLSSTSSDQAPTAYALKQVYDLANGKQNPTRLSNEFATPSNDIIDYPDGISFFWVTRENGQAWCNAAFGDTGQGYGWVTTYKAGSSGYQVFTEMYTGTSQSATTGARQAKRVKRDSNTFWQPFIREIDSTGGTINGPLIVSENDFRVTGWEKAAVLTHTGTEAPNAWRIQPGGDGNLYFQLADKTTGLRNGGDMLIIQRDGNILWPGGDLNSLKSSVANGKNEIAAAIRDKGQSAQGSDAFATMAAAIRNISTGKKVITGSIAFGNKGQAYDDLDIDCGFPPHSYIFQSASGGRMTFHNGSGNWPYLLPNGLPAFLPWNGVDTSANVQFDGWSVSGNLIHIDLVRTGGAGTTIPGNSLYYMIFGN